MKKSLKLGKNVKIIEPSNLYECELEDGVFVGPFVEIQRGSILRKNSKVSSHSFVCEGVEIGENTFIAHGVMFINDKFDSDNIKNWNIKKTKVGKNVRIGSNATILPVNIGDNAIIGAGSVVTKDIPANSTVYGNPAK